MPKKKTTRTRTAASSAEATTPAQLNKQLQRLDLELVRLLNERAALARQSGRLSQELADVVAGEVAQQQRVDRAVASSKGPLGEHAVRAVFRELLSGTRSLLRGLRVVYLGPEFSYSHIAAVEKFGTSAELVPVLTIAAVFDALNRGQADYGLVPVENSTDGRVTDTLDMFARLPVQICGEVQLRIHHYLLGKCARSEVREVYSKPQALSQCRMWLARHLPEARTVEIASTAAAARLAREKPGAAAIASRQAGINYGLDFLAEEIEDNRHNVTRFAVIGDRPGRRTGHDKTSLMFELSHQPVRWPMR